MQAVVRRKGITVMPCSIFRISICIFRLVFEPHMHTNALDIFFLCFFQTSYGHSCIFFRSVVSVISLGKKQKQKQKSKTQRKKTGFPLVGWWCVINTVKKNHIQLRQIERAMAKQRLWQHLGPAELLSSLTRTVPGTYIRPQQ